MRKVLNDEFLKEIFNMELTINGEIYNELPMDMTVAALLLHLQLPKGKIAVERNLEIVPKSSFANQKLSDGDKLEIIHFIGGG
jgi:thiamine biosynthesis protein ThiS